MQFLCIFTGGEQTPHGTYHHFLLSDCDDKNKVPGPTGWAHDKCTHRCVFQELNDLNEEEPTTQHLDTQTLETF